MSARTYSACLHPVPNHGPAPASFLDTLIDTISALPDDVFAENAHDDIYSVIVPVLGPWRRPPNALGHRRAAMAETLRVLAGFESGWNWNEGRDATAGYEAPAQQETGAFQVSADSLAFDRSLQICVDRVCGAHDAQTFIHQMKVNHAFAIEYAARLLRFDTRWDGPINRGWVARAVWRPAVAEFEKFLSPSV